MAYRGSPLRLLVLLLVYMLMIAAACALLVLDDRAPADSRPRRTRPPLIKEIGTWL